METVMRTEKVAYCRLGKKDVDAGIQKDPHRCAIQQYIKATFPHLTFIRVGKKTIGATDRKEGVRIEWATPLSVKRSIQEFDRTGEAEFPAFELRMSEADVRPFHDGRDPEKGRAKARRYANEVRDGSRRPQRRTKRQREADKRKLRNS